MSSEEGFVLGFGELARTKLHLTTNSQWVGDPDLQERTLQQAWSFFEDAIPQHYSLIAKLDLEHPSAPKMGRYWDKYAKHCHL